MEEPFQRVAVDLVGPIQPTTERGHRYILVLVDYATRYPEAVPMKTIEAEAVAEKLLGIYSRLGFPKGGINRSRISVCLRHYERGK